LHSNSLADKFKQKKSRVLAKHGISRNGECEQTSKNWTLPNVCHCVEPTFIPLFIERFIHKIIPKKNENISLFVEIS
jgi:hypothetical protein